jgi:2-hydroxy-3-keto-5-methylthiopentenyl-1-phosphate phosphatase
LRTIQFFLDFDGTITNSDVVDLVLDHFASSKWKQIEKEWASGEIGSRECLSRQVELIRATPEQLNALVSRVTVDPHFVAFLHKAEQLGVLVTIVSDGFDIIISQILKKNLSNSSGYLKALPIFSNRLVKSADGFKAVFPNENGCEHGCANCKASLIKRLTSPEDHVLFVGDGLSDRYAAQTAHVTFAKGKLLAYCHDKNIDAIPYDNFKKITEWLTDNHGILKKAVFK